MQNEIVFKNIFGEDERLSLDEVLSVAFNADCMELLSALPDKCIDLAIVDPPYGIRADSFKNMNGKSDPAYESVAERSRKARTRFSGRGKLKNRILSIADTSWDITPPRRNILTRFSGFRKTRSSGEATISIFLLRDALSCGTRGSHGRISHRPSTHGRASTNRARCLR